MSGPQAQGGFDEQRGAAPSGGPKLCSTQDVQRQIVRLPDWSLTKDGKGIACELRMKDFSSAVELLGRVAKIADEADHHPDVHLTGYRTLRLELSTHSAGGLTQKDFDMAARIGALPKALKS